MKTTRLVPLLFILFCSPLFAAESVILFLGDSLTAGYGVRREESYPERLSIRLKAKAPNIKVINGAESGSLSSSLNSRLNFFLNRFKPKLIVIASGGNDARQLTDIKEIEKNLAAAIDLGKKSGATVALAQMQIFPNLGKEYADAFKKLYPRLARNHKIVLLPFPLTGVAGVAELNQSDGFHPNAKGHEKISLFLQPYLEKLL
ncbi:MAG: arylesterase [Bdellovibrionales bacterium]